MEAAEAVKKRSLEKFTAVLTSMILLPLLLIGFFFLVLGLKFEVLEWSDIIFIDLIMTFGYIMGWFMLRFYLLKAFHVGKFTRPKKPARPEKPLVKGK